MPRGRVATTSIINGLKRCTMCKQEKPPSEFNPDPRGKDGLVARCKHCAGVAVNELQKRKRAGSWKSRLYAERKDLAPEQRKEVAQEDRRRREAVRRERKKGEGSLTLREWHDIKAAYSQRCAFCGARARLTVDHVVPLDAGGKHVASNVVPACVSCNSRKGPRPAPTHQPILII